MDGEGEGEEEGGRGKGAWVLLLPNESDDTHRPDGASIHKLEKPNSPGVRGRCGLFRRLPLRPGNVETVTAQRRWQNGNFR